MDGGKDSRPPPPNPAMPYREDCWSEGATSALIDAWGDRYLDLNRGNLRQKDWQEVADAVNSRRTAARRPPRTDSQCKNRIDTLKKKYKVEKSRVSGSSNQWPFFSRLDVLIGPSPPLAAKKTSPSPPLAIPLPANRKPSPLPTARPVEKRPHASLAINGPFIRRNYAAAAAAAAAADGDYATSASSSRERSRSSGERPPKLLKGKSEDEGDEDGIHMLSQAIVRLAKVYEKVEMEKQLQMVEMEKQRLEFAKGLEFQRMQFYMDSQVQIEKMKRGARRADAESYL